MTKQEAAYQQSIVKVSEVVHKFSEAISQDCSKIIDSELKNLQCSPKCSPEWEIEHYESTVKVSKVLAPKWNQIWIKQMLRNAAMQQKENLQNFEIFVRNLFNSCVNFWQYFAIQCSQNWYPFETF